MTIEQVLINIKKELICRKKNKHCENICRDCQGYVNYEDLTDTLQTLYDWISELQNGVIK